MSSLQEMFQAALKLWHNKSNTEVPKNGSETYDHFKKLGSEIGTRAIILKHGGLKVVASVGKGNWAEIPWIGLRNPYLTDNFEQGLYVVYLFAPDYDRLYLSIIQGVTELTAEELDKMTPVLRKDIEKPDGFVVGIQGKLARNAFLNSKPDKYQRGILYSTNYELKVLPTDEDLEKDLKAALTSYREYVNRNLS
jgi:5-methylcytosine-specific restriction protein B